ncbi:potassium transporter Kef [Pseudoclavibacter endophyticus]|uniref:Cation:proton antiporter n=1 Tax=Pseudoclavibacter endophyticus TaxID=1778590 RepID=A0A6H9WV34_9MICO|nr:cation:proton antiporter [Pseudoclavibacter endophyticus]KAB1650060.1 cation:proton antiporter [Pseudoclavibacter endophyticus]GGA57593.1 potassium transporter Kef [Pseudoclavibacter endophyticus]
MDEAHLLIDNLLSMWWIGLAAVLAPILALVTRRVIPDVVWLLAFGVVIGPNVLGVAESTGSVAFIRELGIGFLFLLAGFEVNTTDMRGRQGRHAALTWFICAALGVGAGMLLVQGDWHVAIVLGIASTSTALGTLLPILKDAGTLPTPLGRATLMHGAYGELLPIVAMSLLLSAHGTGLSALLLIAFALAAVLTVAVPGRIFRRVPLLGRAFVAASNSTMQTTLRVTVLVLLTLMLLTAVFELDVALGAFTAGLLLNAMIKGAAPDHATEIMHKVEVVGFSLLIPVFFVTSGMGIDPVAVLEEWPLLVGFVVVIALVRGLPVFLREQWTETHSGLTRTSDRAALGLFAATGLPIIVAVTQVAASSEVITDATASIMVTAGAVTVLVFPLLAGVLLRTRHGTPPRRPAATP